MLGLGRAVKLAAPALKQAPLLEDNADFFLSLRIGIVARANSKVEIGDQSAER